MDLFTNAKSHDGIIILVAADEDASAEKLGQEVLRGGIFSMMY